MHQSQTCPALSPSLLAPCRRAVCDPSTRRAWEVEGNVRHTLTMSFYVRLLVDGGKPKIIHIPKREGFLLLTSLSDLSKGSVLPHGDGNERVSRKIRLYRRYIILSSCTVPSERIHTPCLFHILLCYSRNVKLTGLHTIPHNVKVDLCF